MHKPQIHKNAISVKWIICTCYPKFVWRKLIYFLFFGGYKGEYGEYYIKAKAPFVFCALCSERGVQREPALHSVFCFFLLSG